MSSDDDSSSSSFISDCPEVHPWQSLPSSPIDSPSPPREGVRRKLIFEEEEEEEEEERVKLKLLKTHLSELTLCEQFNYCNSDQGASPAQRANEFSWIWHNFSNEFRSMCETILLLMRYPEKNPNLFNTDSGRELKLRSMGLFFRQLSELSFVLHSCLSDGVVGPDILSTTIAKAEACCTSLWNVHDTICGIESSSSSSLLRMFKHWETFGMDILRKEPHLIGLPLTSGWNAMCFEQFIAVPLYNVNITSRPCGICKEGLECNSTAIGIQQRCDTYPLSMYNKACFLGLKEKGKDCNAVFHANCLASHFYKGVVNGEYATSSSCPVCSVPFCLADLVSFPVVGECKRLKTRK